MIPTMISGFFGMNVPNLWNENNVAFPVIVGGSIIISVLISVILVKRKLF